MNKLNFRLKSLYLVRSLGGSLDELSPCQSKVRGSLL